MAKSNNPWIGKRDPLKPQERFFFPVSTTPQEAERHWAAFLAVGNWLDGPPASREQESDR